MDICLVNMPYGSLVRPSIGLGLLKSALKKTQLKTTCVYANLDFAERIGIDRYIVVDGMATEDLVGEWTFCDALYGTGRIEDGYLEWIHEQFADSLDIESFKEFLFEVRRTAVEFVDDTVSAILAKEPYVVGCTSVFQQHIASLALLRQIKDRSPRTATMMGGANCEGPMGEATHRNFPWVDYVVSGEADDIIADLCLGIVGSKTAVPYRCPDQAVLSPAHRGNAASTALGTGAVTDMDLLPVPDYDDYFGALVFSSIGKLIRPGVPFEASRGCWWGAISHCTFCGLNGGSMTSRVRSTERVIEDIDTLFEKHGSKYFTAVDNIMAIEHLKSLMPTLRDRPDKFSIFFETKANLKRGDVELLADAGVRWVQPGIESLHTEVLKLMRKGLKAWANIQLLKWSMEFGVRLLWNIIVGFPGEQDSWYAEASQWVPLVSHLQPPIGVSRMRVDRFSPYHARPGDWDLAIEPARSYRSIYPFENQEIGDLAYFFERAPHPGGEPEEGSGLKAFRECIDGWTAAQNAKPPPEMFFVDDGSRLSVTDTRPVSEGGHQEFYGIEREILLACDDAPPEALLPGKLTHAAHSNKQIAGIVAGLVDKKLLFRLDGRIVFPAIRPPLRKLPMLRSFPNGVALPVSRSEIAERQWAGLSSEIPSSAASRTGQPASA